MCQDDPQKDMWMAGHGLVATRGISGVRKRAIDGNRYRKLSAHLMGIFWCDIHAKIAPPECSRVAETLEGLRQGPSPMAQHVVLRGWYAEGEAAGCAGMGGLWAWHGHWTSGVDHDRLALPCVIVRNEAMRMVLLCGLVTSRQGRVLAPGASTDTYRLRQSQRTGDEHAKEVPT
jgi:hypothetical protein